MAEFERLRIVVVRPPRMGGDHTAQVAGQLLEAYRPRCIAMCGVCAGHPERTALGERAEQDDRNGAHAERPEPPRLAGLAFEIGTHER